MTFQVISPLDGQLLKEIPRWDNVQVENALQKSAEAAPRWASLSVVERANYLRKLGTLIRKRKRSEERRVGKECRIGGSSPGCPYH